MANPTDPFALTCAFASAICAFGYLFGAVSHRVTAGQGHVLVDEAGDPNGFWSVMAFQAVGAALLAAAALLVSLLGTPLPGLVI